MKVASTNFRRTEIIQNVVSNHKKIKLEIENRYLKNTNIFKIFGN